MSFLSFFVLLSCLASSCSCILTSSCFASTYCPFIESNRHISAATPPPAPQIYRTTTSRSRRPAVNPCDGDYQLRPLRLRFQPGESAGHRESSAAQARPRRKQLRIFPSAWSFADPEAPSAALRCSSFPLSSSAASLHGTSHTGEASVPATAIRAGCHVRPPRSALLIKRSNALSSAVHAAHAAKIGG